MHAPRGGSTGSAKQADKPSAPRDVADRAGRRRVVRPVDDADGSAFDQTIVDVQPAGR